MPQIPLSIDAGAAVIRSLLKSFYIPSDSLSGFVLVHLKSLLTGNRRRSPGDPLDQSRSMSVAVVAQEGILEIEIRAAVL